MYGNQAYETETLMHLTDLKVSVNLHLRFFGRAAQFSGKTLGSRLGKSKYKVQLHPITRIRKGNSSYFELSGFRRKGHKTTDERDFVLARVL